MGACESSNAAVRRLYDHHLASTSTAARNINNNKNTTAASAAANHNHHNTASGKTPPHTAKRNSMLSTDTRSASELQSPTGAANNGSSTSLLTQRRSNGSDYASVPALNAAGGVPGRPSNAPGNHHRRTSLKSRASLTSVGSIPENVEIQPPPPQERSSTHTAGRRPYSFKKPKGTRFGSVVGTLTGLMGGGGAGAGHESEDGNSSLGGGRDIPDEKIDALYMLFADEELDYDLAMKKQDEERRKTKVSTKRVSSASSSHPVEDRRGSKDSKGSKNGDADATTVPLNDEDASSGGGKAKLQRSNSAKATKRPGRSFFKSRSKSYVAAEALDAQDPIDVTPDMANLLLCLSTVDSRNRLVQRLMGIKGGLSVLVRFITAVDQYENATADLAEQKRLGDKIVSIFLDDERGRFGVKIRDETRKHLVVDGFLNFLPYAKLEILRDLAQNEEVMEMLGEGGAVLPDRKITQLTPKLSSLSSPTSHGNGNGNALPPPLLSLDDDE